MIETAFQRARSNSISACASGPLQTKFGNCYLTPEHFGAQRWHETLMGPALLPLVDDHFKYDDDQLCAAVGGYRFRSTQGAP